MLTGRVRAVGGTETQRQAHPVIPPQLRGSGPRPCMKSTANDLALTGDNTPEVTPGCLPASPPTLPRGLATPASACSTLLPGHFDHDNGTVDLH